MNHLFGGFFTGINYWGSKSAVRMWREYDGDSVENDLRLLREAGITMLRVFPNWEDFQPLTAFTVPGGRVYEYGLRGEPFPDTPAGQAGVDEEMCRRFEDFCARAQRYGMRLIVGLLTGHMSFQNMIPQALVNLNLMTDPRAVRWEIKYLRYLVGRFREIPNIAAWDLGNEVNCLMPNGTKDEFYTWTATLAGVIKSTDPSRPVASGVGGFEVVQGFPNLYDLGDCCDINTVHAYNIFETPRDPVNSMKPVLDHVFKCRLSRDIGGMPTFLQEFGAIGYLNCSRTAEAEFYRATVLSSLAHGCHGVMYWCAFDQGHLTFPPYNWNNKGSDYGFFDANLQPKPIAEENLRLQEFLKAAEALPEPEPNCTIIVPRDEGQSGKSALRAAYLLAKRANLEPEFTYALDPIPHRAVYILPSVKYDMALPANRLGELMDRVREGAVLYLSLDRAYFRKIPELAGVTVESRVDCPRNLTLTLEGKALPLTAPVTYDLRPAGCEVLSEDGAPVYVKQPLGKGFVYLLFAPVEEYLGGKQGAFYEEGCPAYDEIYRAFACYTDRPKLAEIRSGFILHTEHRHPDGCVNLFAVNYSNREQQGEVVLPEGYALTGVCGGALHGNKITLAPCDGMILRAAPEEFLQS